MSWCKLMYAWHPLLWLVPALFAALLAAFGARLGRKGLWFFSLAGLGWTFLQGAAAALFLLWGTSSQSAHEIRIPWLGGSFATFVFTLRINSVWAILVTSLLAFAVQWYSLISLARFARRHRFNALVLMLVASAGLFFCADAEGVAGLLGWEGLALSGAFLSGFWISEQGGGRTGLRWLLFQRLSGVLLVLGFLWVPQNPNLGAMFIIAAACVRSGQVPFHGWFPDTTMASAPASALLHGVSSSLASVYLLDHFRDLVYSLPSATELLGGVGLAGIVLGILAGLQQHQTHKTMGWLFLVLNGLAWMGFAVKDPVATTLLVTGWILAFGGVILTMGTENDPVAGLAQDGAKRVRTSTRWVLLALGWSLVLPPGLGFAGLGRLMTAMPGQLLGVVERLVVLMTLLGGGWIFQWFSRSLAYGQLAVLEGGTSRSRVLDWAPLSLAVVVFGLGLVGWFLNGTEFVGGVNGVCWASAAAAAALAGWILSWYWGMGRTGLRFNRLTPAERFMDRIADTGLGLGEVVVQVSLGLVRGAGVLIWHVLGDLLLDGLLLGLAVRTVEGVGLVLRFLQNGRVHRYALVAVAAVLVLVLVIARE